MKKLFAVVVMALTFTVSAQAQDKKAPQDFQAAAKNDVAALVQKVTVDESLKKDMYTLMVMKHEMLANAVTPADKQKVSEMIEHKVLAGLRDDQRKQVVSDADLLKRLTH